MNESHHTCASSSNPNPAHLPQAAIFCAHFLPRDQQHVYRQVDHLPHWQTQIFSWKRDHAQAFPFPEERLHPVPTPWTRELQRLQGKLRRRPWQISPAEARQLLQQIRSTQAEILHIYFGHVASHLLPLLELPQTPPTLVSFHGADLAIQPESPSHQQLQRVFQLAKLLLARSQDLLAQLAQLGAPADKLRLWRAGIDLQTWPEFPRQVPEGGHWQLTQACRFQAKKGLDTSLRAFAILRKQWPNAKLTLAGDGQEKDSLLALTQELQLEDAVHFPGFLNQEQLQALYQQSHILLHPSRTTESGDCEGVPNALLEAMATGLPIAATKHGGIPEALTSTHSLQVPENDHQALAAGLQKWLETPKLWREAAADSRARVETAFALENQRARLSQLYAEAKLLGATKERGHPAREK